jgi:hypothetical protein
MHAQIDNLLTVLSQNAFLDALDEGTAALVILGDAVHSEVDGQLREMDSSMLLMDLIFKLKLCFPAQVFYVRGNHDSFSEDMSKDGDSAGPAVGEGTQRAAGVPLTLKPWASFTGCCPTWSLRGTLSLATPQHPRPGSARRCW